jgi:hypothetical protein
MGSKKVKGAGGERAGEKLRLEVVIDLADRPDLPGRLDRARKRFGETRPGYMRRVLLLAVEKDEAEAKGKGVDCE